MTEEYLSEDDVFVKRNEEGEVLPVDADAMGYGTVRVIPMTYGEAEETFGEGGMEELEEDVVANVISEYLIEPDLDLTGDDISDRMEPMAPQALLMAIMEASGLRGNVSVNQDGEATIEFEEGN